MNVPQFHIPLLNIYPTPSAKMFVCLFSSSGIARYIFISNKKEKKALESTGKSSQLAEAVILPLLFLSTPPLSPLFPLPIQKRKKKTFWQLVYLCASGGLSVKCSLC